MDAKAVAPIAALFGAFRQNQLEKSNHDHLGKLITYMTAIAAKTAIWIVADPRPEHVNAISWLNESSTGSFFLVKIDPKTVYWRIVYL